MASTTNQGDGLWGMVSYRHRALLWDSDRQAFVTQSTAEGAHHRDNLQPVHKLLYGDNKAALNRTLENKAFAHHSTCVERSSQETRAGMAGVWWARHSMPSD